MQVFNVNSDEWGVGQDGKLVKALRTPPYRVDRCIGVRRLNEDHPPKTIRTRSRTVDKAVFGERVQNLDGRFIENTLHNCVGN